MDQIDRAFSIRGMDSRCALVKVAFVPDQRPADFTASRLAIRDISSGLAKGDSNSSFTAVKALVQSTCRFDCFSRNKESICAASGKSWQSYRIVNSDVIRQIRSCCPSHHRPAVLMRIDTVADLQITLVTSLRPSRVFSVTYRERSRGTRILRLNCLARVRVYLPARDPIGRLVHDQIDR